MWITTDNLAEYVYSRGVISVQSHLLKNESEKEEFLVDSAKIFVILSEENPLPALLNTVGFRDRNARVALFDGIEDGGIRASSSYSSHEIDEQENDRAMEGLQDRVIMLKRLSGDIHEEVDSHNRMLDRMGNDMDTSRGVLSGTMDKFKMVFENKSSRRMFTLVASFVAVFLIAGQMLYKTK
ncbi:Bet1-like SNARE 1-1 [Salvia divinorum]|uniref:Bet1-like SNARE 1-1 n=1 Tax=Salvia divinorum TaxID=28513 RepID=A0ABD1GYF8_SALDI